MAVPTFTSVSPNKGPVAGQNFVLITGTNFRLPLAQPSYGPSVVRVPSVSVEFGSESALVVEVASATELWIRVPPFRGTATDDPLAAVSITIKNLDDLGIPIPTETVTALTAYTYRRPIIHDTVASPTKAAAPYVLATAELILLLRRQVFSNVVQTTHVDYSEPGVLAIAISKIPGLILQGPVIGRDLERWHNETVETDLGGGVYSLRQPPFVAKLGYTILGVSNNEAELLGMMGSLQACFDSVKYLDVQINPLVPATGRARLVLQQTEGIQVTSAPSDSNIRSFSATCEVRGLEIYPDDAFDQAQVVTTADMEVQQFDGLTLEVIHV